MTVRRILFVAEAVTLAQVVRLAALAKALQEPAFEVHFASAHFPPLVFKNAQMRCWNITSRSPDDVAKDVAWGRRIYNRRTLQRYVDADLRLFAAVQPDLVVSDLRWSLAISAAHAKIKHAALINAYWSPFLPRKKWPMPDHPIIALLGEKHATRGFAQALPYVFAHHAAPINALRKRYKLSALGSLQEVLTAGDWLLHPDVPSLAPLKNPPPQHHTLGTIHWEPDVPLPRWFEQRRRHRPLVYVTMGSSGSLAGLQPILDGLREVSVDVALATAGRTPQLRATAEPQFLAADYLPGFQVARQAELVICNGGSTTGYQALAAGCPVLAIPMNLDQHLATQAMVERGVGAALPARQVTASRIAFLVRSMLDGGHRKAAGEVAAEMRQYNACQRFRNFVSDVASAERP